MRAMACALLLATLFTGCASMRDRFSSAGSEPSASPGASSDKVSCEMSGGKWNVFTRNCDRG
jgi:hypothetical protein